MAHRPLGKRMEDHGAASHVLFGLDPLWVSACLLVATYATIITERINRSIIALLGAGPSMRRSAASTSTPSASSPA